MKTGTLFLSLLLAAFAVGCRTPGSYSGVRSNPAVSISLVPHSATFDIEEARRGAVSFTASIRNGTATTINIAYPTICFPTDHMQGETRHLNDFHGKSEILLKITRPDGADVVLRDGYFHYFDPGNVPLLTIPPDGTGTFYMGWFFQNARGRWERDEEAAKVFLLKGKYKIRVLFRNVFPYAATYDSGTGENTFVDVWTGEMESGEITVEVR